MTIQAHHRTATVNGLLVRFDHEHTTQNHRGENGGRTFFETNVVRSIRSVGDWSGSALDFREHAPEGQDAAVIVEAPDGRIVGAARLSGGSIQTKPSVESESGLEAHGSPIAATASKKRCPDNCSRFGNDEFECSNRKPGIDPTDAPIPGQKTSAPGSIANFHRPRLRDDHYLGVLYGRPRPDRTPARRNP